MGSLSKCCKPVLTYDFHITGGLCELIKVLEGRLKVKIECLFDINNNNNINDVLHGKI